MKQYINYQDLNIIQRHTFNSTGQCPVEYVMTEAQWREKLAQVSGENGVNRAIGDEGVGQGGVERIDVLV